MHQETIQVALKSFLGVHEISLLPEGQQIFVAALETVAKQYPMLAPLDALFSADPDTFALNQAERDTLLGMLKKSLPYDRDRHVFSVFHENVFLQEYAVYQKKVDPRPLRLLHADVNNLGVNEKFLLGKLKPHVWLTDLDLKRFVQRFDLQDTVKVARLSASDIGMVMHFARRENQAKSTEKTPYSIQMILNKGEKGDITSQGVHWIEAKFTIDPSKTPNGITVTYSDTLPMSAEEQSRVEKIIRDGLRFSEQGESVEHDLRAFPDADIQFSRAAVATQSNGWSCGYYALQNALKRMPEAHFPSLEEFLSANNPAALRTAVYRVLLNDMALPADLPAEVMRQLPDSVVPTLQTEASRAIYFDTFLETMDHSANSAALVDLKTLMQLKSDKETEDQIVKKLEKTIKPTEKVGVVSVMEMEDWQDQVAGVAEIVKHLPNDTALRISHFDYEIDLRQLFLVRGEELTEELSRRRAAGVAKLIGAIRGSGGETGKYFFNRHGADLDIPPSLIPYFSNKVQDPKEVKELIRLLQIEKYHVVKKSNSFSVDLKALLAEHTENRSVALEALVRFCNEQKIQYMEVSDLLPLTEADIKILEKLKYVTAVTFSKETSVDTPTQQCFKQISARNKLIRFLKIPLDTSDEPVWFSFYEARFSNKMLLGSVRESNDIFTLDSGITIQEKMVFFNVCLKEAGAARLQGLLDFLEAREDFFKKNPKQFTYKTLHLSEISQGEYETLSVPLTDHVKVLAAHLAQERYFPFSTITFNLTENFFNDETVFQYFFDMVSSLEKYQHVTQISINGCDLSKSQYARLTELFKAKKLTIKIDTNLEYSDEKYVFHNIISSNLRLKNSEKRKVISSASKHEDVPTLSQPSKPVKPKREVVRSLEQTRLCKLSGFNPLGSISIDVSHQAEKQHQQQAQLQQQTQVSQAVQKQSENEVTDSSAFGMSGIVKTTKSGFLDQYASEISIEQQWIQSAGRECYLVTFDAFHDPVNGKRHFISQLYDRFMGAHDLPKSFRYLTPAAASSLLNTPQHFLNGLNFDNLPAGFYVQYYTDTKNPENNGYLLCYDAIKFVENKNQSPLTPSTTLRPKWQKWIGDARQFGLPEKAFWTVFSSGKADVVSLYNLDDLTDLFVSILSSFAPHHTALIAAYEAYLPPSKSHIAAKTGKEIFALMDILYHQGIEGLSAFLEAIASLQESDPDLYRHFKHYFLNASDDIEPVVVMELMTTESLSIIKKLADLTPAQKVWWKNIVECERKNNSHLDLAALYNGFQYFLSKLPSGVALPAVCPLSGYNPLVQLDRLLSILGSVNANNLSDQLLSFVERNEAQTLTLIAFKNAILESDFIMSAEIHAQFQSILVEGFAHIDPRGILHELAQIKNLEKGATISLDQEANQIRFVEEMDALIKQQQTAIDLTTDGAWYATRWDNFHFVHPKMELTGDAIQLSGISAKRSYRIEYSDLEKLALAPENGSLENGVIAFHRFVGCRAAIAVAYENYITLTNQLEAADFPDALKIKLLPLFAIATTGLRGSLEINAATLMNYVTDNKTNPQLSVVLDAIVARIEKQVDQPTLMELMGIIRIAMHSSDPANAVSKLFENALSDTVLMTFSLWQSHDNHLSSDEFLTAWEEIKKSDANQFQYTSRILGLMRSVARHNLAALTAKMIELKDHAGYKVLLPILAAINADKTPPEKLPTADELRSVFATLTALPEMTSSQAVIWLTQQFPSCIFNRKEAVISGHLSAATSDETDVFSTFLALHRLSPYSSTTMTSELMLQYQAALQSQIEKQAGEEKLAELRTKSKEAFESTLSSQVSDKVTAMFEPLTPAQKREMVGGPQFIAWQETIVQEIEQINAMLDENMALFRSPESIAKLSKTSGLKERFERELRHIDIDKFRRHGADYLVAEYTRVIGILPEIAPYFLDAKPPSDTPVAAVAAADAPKKKGGVFASIGNAFKNAAIKAVAKTDVGKAEIIKKFRAEIKDIAPNFLAIVDKKAESKKEEKTDDLDVKVKNILSADIERKLKAEHHEMMSHLSLDAESMLAVNEKKARVTRDLNTIFPAYAKYKFLSSVEKSIRIYPELKELKSLYPEPLMQENLQEYLNALHQYATPLSALFDVLVKLNAQWQDHLKLDFLISSTMQAWLAPAALKDIFEAIHAQKFDYVPTQLFNAIFPRSIPSSMLQLSEEAKKHFVNAVVATIQAEGLSLKNKTQLIEVLYEHAAHPEKIRALISKLKEVSADFPSFSSSVFTLWFNGLHNEIEIDYNDTIELLKTPNVSPTVLEIIFSSFSGNKESVISEDFVKLLNHIKNSDPAKNGVILTILAFGALRDDYDASKEEVRNAIFGADKLLSKLFLLEVKKLTELFELYSKVPRPRLERLLALLEKLQDILSYEKDPFGFRSDSKKLDAQFDLSTIHHRIDALVDLNRGDSTALFRNDRQTLHQGMGYVFAVGRQYDLVIPDATDAHSAMHLPVKDLSADQLKQLVSHYRSVISNDKHSADTIWQAKLEFVALLREAMYRATGKMPYDTQILNLLNVILQGGNVFSEIRTGEGKTIVTALMAALKWAEGGAVDVCSANMVLAKRDLAEMQDFFDCLGIKTGCITASSRYEAYQQDGVNYSDISELSLWQQQQLLLQNPLPEKVSLIADEVDFNVLDNTTQFRYAASLDPTFDEHHNPFSELYPHVLNFVLSDDLFRHKLCSPAEDIINLRDYIENLPSSVISKTIKNKFSAMPDVTLDRWIDSAFIATQLREDVDYAVRQNTLTRNNEEISVSEAQVKLNFRVNPQSRFSEGVHQFLHTYLNQRMDKDAAFRKKCGGHTFVVEPEKTYLASRSAKNTMDYYIRGNPPRGDVLGLTGTLGTRAERNELRKKYNARCFKVPPHHILKRKQLNPVLAKDKAFFEKILESVKQAQKNGQCVLIICDGVASSEALHAFLKDKISKEKLQLHNGEQLNQDDEVVAKKAGEIGMVTVSTPMFGRGTDIKPKGTKGLHVVTTCLSEEREYGQNIGRAGRNGAEGSDQLILSEKEFTSRGMDVPSKDNLVAAIKTVRDELASHKSHERYQRDRFSDIKDQFFAQFCALSKSAKEKLGVHFVREGSWGEVAHQNYITWESFLKFFDKEQNRLLTELGGEKDNTRLDEKLVQFVTLLNSQWTDTALYLVEKINEAFFSELDKKPKDGQSAEKPDAFQWPASPVKVKLDDFSETQAVRHLDLSPNRLAASLPASHNLPAESYFVLSRSELEKHKKEKEKILSDFVNQVNQSLFKLNPLNLQVDPVKNKIFKIAEKLLSEYQHIHRKNGVVFPMRNAFLLLCDKVSHFGDDSCKNQIIAAFSAVDQEKLTGDLKSEFAFFETKVEKLKSQVADKRTHYSSSLSSFDRIDYLLQKELQQLFFGGVDLIRFHHMDLQSRYRSLLPDDGVISKRRIDVLDRVLFHVQNIFLRENTDISNSQFTQFHYDTEKKQIVLTACYKNSEEKFQQVSFTFDWIQEGKKANIKCRHEIKEIDGNERAEASAVVINCERNHLILSRNSDHTGDLTVAIQYNEKHKYDFRLSDVIAAFQQPNLPQIAFKNLLEIVTIARNDPESIESHAWRHVQFDLLKKRIEGAKKAVTQTEFTLLLETAKRCHIVCDLSGLDLSNLNFAGKKFHNVKFDNATLTDVTIDQFTEFHGCSFVNITSDHFRWQRSNRDHSVSSSYSTTPGQVYAELQSQSQSRHDVIKHLNSENKNDAEKIFHCFQSRKKMSGLLDGVYNVFSPLSEPLVEGKKMPSKQVIIGKVSYKAGVVFDFSGTDLREAKLDSRVWRDAVLDDAKLTQSQIYLLIKLGCGHKVSVIDQSVVDHEIFLSHADLSGKDLRELSDKFVITDTTNITACRINRSLTEKLLADMPQQLQTVNFNDLDLSNLDLTTLDFSDTTISETTELDLRNATISKAQIDQLIGKQCGTYVGLANLNKLNLRSYHFDKIGIQTDTSLAGAKITADQARWLITHQLGSKLRDIDLSGQNLKGLFGENEVVFSAEIISENTLLSGSRLSVKQAVWLSEQCPTALTGVILENLDLRDLRFKKLTAPVVKSMQLSGVIFNTSQLNWLIENDCKEKIQKLDLREVNFEEILQWDGVVLTGAKITADQARWLLENNKGALLQDADLSDADLITIDCVGYFTEKTVLENAKITSAQAKVFEDKGLSAKLKKLILEGLDLSVLATQDFFENANLSQCRLSNLQLKELQKKHPRKIDQLDLSNTHLEGINFTGRNLTKTRFQENSIDHFSDVNLEKAKINQEQLNFLLSYDTLRDHLKKIDASELDFSSFEFDENFLRDICKEITLNRAHLSNAQLKILIDVNKQKVSQLNLAETDLKNCDLSDLDLTKTDFQRNKIENITGINLTRATITAEQAQWLIENDQANLLKMIRLTGQDLRKVNLQSLPAEVLTTMDFTGAKLSAEQVADFVAKGLGEKCNNVDLSLAILERAALTCAGRPPANLRGATISQETIAPSQSLVDVKINSDQLMKLLNRGRKKLNGLDCSDLSFDGINFSAVDFSAANFSHVQMTNCRVSKSSNFAGADFSGATLDLFTFKSFFDADKEGALRGATLSFELNGENKTLYLREKGGLQKCYDDFLLFYKEEKKHGNILFRWKDFAKELEDSKLSLLDKIEKIFEHIERYPERRAAAAFERALAASTGEVRNQHDVAVRRDEQNTDTVFVDKKADYFPGSKTIGFENVNPMAPVVAMCDAFMRGQKFVFVSEEKADKKVDTLSEQIKQFARTFSGQQAKNLMAFASVVAWVNQQGGPAVVNAMAEVDRNRFLKRVQSTTLVTRLFSEKRLLADVPSELLDVVKGVSSTSVASEHTKKH